MLRIATIIMTAGAWAGALSAQSTPPQGQNLTPQAPQAQPDNQRALRDFMKKYGRLERLPQNFQVRLAPELLARAAEPPVCSIPLLEVPVAKNLEKMPVLRPRAEIDRMPLAKLPAPPCPEEKR